jgi:ubiquitin fusion degradation protein 1
MVAVRPELEDSGKIILPPRALGVISQLNLQYPLMFEVANEKFRDRVTHAGVLEFTAEEGRVYIPYWMMQNVRLEPNDIVKIESRTLKGATFVRLQPQSVEFLDISNPRAVLEQKLRNYSALTEGDTILFLYNKKEYFLQVLEIQPKTPNKAVSIVETDVKVDFAPPIGYKEPEPQKAAPPPQPTVDKSMLDPSQQVEEEESESEDKREEFVPFGGQGARISGKKVDSAAVKKKDETPAEQKVTVIDSKGQVVQKTSTELAELRKLREQHYQKKLEADKAAQSKNPSTSSNGDSEFKPFAGTGYRMK